MEYQFGLANDGDNKWWWGSNYFGKLCQQHCSATFTNGGRVVSLDLTEHN